jgi:hypothetical protein
VALSGKRPALSLNGKHRHPNDASLRLASRGFRYDVSSAYLRVYGLSYYVLTIIIGLKKFPP